MNSPPNIDFRDRNAVERFLEGAKFRRCTNLRCESVSHPKMQMLYMPVCLEGRFAKEGVAQHIEMPLGSRPLSPITYTTIPQRAPLIKDRADGTESIAGLKALDDFCGFEQKTNSDGKTVVTNRGMNATQLTTDLAARFIRKRKGDGVGNAAINRSLACLRRMLTIAKRAKKIHDVPFIEFLKEPPARKGFLTIERFEELIALLPTHLRPLVTLLYYCGTRIGEALQIEWSQVDLDARTIRLEEEQTKTDEARTLPLPPALVMMLSDIEPKTGRVFDGTNLRKEWTKACAQCGLGTLTEVEGRPYDPIYSGLTLHDLRRSAVRNLINAGVPERVAMSISGHKTRSVFDRYHIVSTEDVTNAMQRVVTASLGTGKTSNKKALSSNG